MSRRTDNYLWDVEHLGGPAATNGHHDHVDDEEHVDGEHVDPGRDPDHPTLTHLRALHGDTEGYVFFAVGRDPYVTDTGKVKHHSFKETTFAWPRQADAIAAHVDANVDADVWFTPALSQNPLRDSKRRKPLPVRVLWADLDHVAHPERVQQLLLDGGAWRVASGSPGRQHLYVPLVEPVDAVVAEDLLRRLADWLDADPSVTWHGAYLRPLGGWNHKAPALGTGPAAPVELLDEPCEPRWTAGDLDDLLPVVEHVKVDVTVPNAEPVTGRLPDEVAELLEERVVDGMNRSERIFAAVGVCHRAGLSDGQILTVMRQHPPAVHKWGDADKIDVDVARCLAKIKAERQLFVIDHPELLDVPASWSDAHVGEAFGQTLIGRWLYCRALGGWLEWDGRRWRPDPGEAVFEEFRRWIIRLGEQIWKLDGDGETMKRVGRYRDRGKIDAAVIIARRLEGIAARADEFDQHPELLNCHNGVVDLRTGELRPHDPALRLRQLAGADYRPGATHPDVEAVKETMSPEVRDWVQKLLGSAAVGNVVDDIVAVFDGKGANGKTTLLKAVYSSLGGYATSASTRLLIARATHDEHPTLIADLFGRRLVYIEETPEGGALRMEQLKALSGGTPVKARFIARDQFEFIPTHQFIIATNHRPAVNASDYAAWRRLRLVPFPHTYRKPHEARDGDRVADLGLRGRLNGRAQREAMLAWIIEGAVRWHREGLGGCPEVDAATDAWRRSEDVIEAWWADSVTVLDTAEVAASDLYQSFKSWCEANGRRPPSNKEFSKKLIDHELYEHHHIERARTAGGFVYRGLWVTTEGVL